MQSVVTMPNSDRRKMFTSMIGWQRYLYFDGIYVCANFLLEAFNFSRDLQAYVRSLLDVLNGRNVAGSSMVQYTADRSGPLGSIDQGDFALSFNNVVVASRYTDRCSQVEIISYLYWKDSRRTQEMKFLAWRRTIFRYFGRGMLMIIYKLIRDVELWRSSN